MSDDIIILTFSILAIVFGIVGLVYLGYRNNLVEFLGVSDWGALAIFIVAGILTWAGMVWVVNPDFKISNKQWISFGFSIAISFLWWARYVYTVSDKI